MSRLKMLPHFHQIWGSLSFSQIKHTPERREEWEHWAEMVLGELLHGNTALIADTAAGKTIISLLVVLATSARVLFLAPQRVLAKQHLELWYKLQDSVNGGTVITGDMAKHDWKTTNRIVFATPQVFWSDYYQGKVHINDFDLLIIDEFHRSVGKYHYVPIAELAVKFSLKILCLTASPGSNLEKILTVAKNLFITKWVNATIKTPKKLEDLVIAEPDDAINTADENFSYLLKICAAELKACGLQYKIEPDRRLSMTDIKNIDKEISTWRQYGLPEFFQAISMSARYKKLLRAYRLLITESYFAFLGYAEELKIDEKKSSWEIANNLVFQSIIKLAQDNIDKHPKINILLKVIRQHNSIGRNGLIFISEKKHAPYIKDLLESQGGRVEMVFGGRNKNIKEITQSLEKLAKKEIDEVISTSVLGEGLNVPEINAVFHYSLPPSAITRLQRSGRTGRSITGNVVFISINHPLDIIGYWKPKKQEEKMKEIVTSFVSMQNGNTLLKPPKPITRKRKKDIWAEQHNTTLF